MHNNKQLKFSNGCANESRRCAKTLTKEIDPKDQGFLYKAW